MPPEIEAQMEGPIAGRREGDAETPSLMKIVVAH
jgi:hypothetical protein